METLINAFPKEKERQAKIFWGVVYFIYMLSLKEIFWESISQMIFGDGFAISSFIFLRIMGILYFFAYLSIATQIHGLVGSHGIYPIKETLEHMRSKGRKFSDTPTLFWFYHSDQAITLYYTPLVPLKFILQNFNTFYPKVTKLICRVPLILFIYSP
eukprot:TRINITY_DN17828_c0_g1_i2.p1 TRINITY_DN17828_c0_g1~~TRINITY_DN17828_c0_g1_i2.p1  ORF type:complete len:157 (-),score=24.90 TRINITY_DN17828_c0_g1_i2:20-490(-)